MTKITEKNSIQVINATYGYYTAIHRLMISFNRSLIPWKYFPKAANLAISAYQAQISDESI